MIQFAKYLFIGVVNTLVGFGTIFLLMYLQFSVELSNALGYMLGIIVSYILNKKYTFKFSKESKFTLLKFFSAMLIAYTINLFVLIILYRFLLVNPYLSQILSGAVYTTTGFFLSKKWVFKK